MTPYKSMSKGACDRIGPQVYLAYGHSHPLHGAVCDDHHHVFAPVCHDALSRNAWCLERSPPSPPVLAGVHASPLPRAENLGRTGALDPSIDHGVAVPPPVEGELLEYPCAGDMVGRGSPAYLAPTQGWDTSSCG